MLYRPAAPTRTMNPCSMYGPWTGFIFGQWTRKKMCLDKGSCTIHLINYSGNIYCTVHWSKNRRSKQYVTDMLLYSTQRAHRYKCRYDLSVTEWILLNPFKPRFCNSCHGASCLGYRGHALLTAVLVPPLALFYVDTRILYTCPCSRDQIIKQFSLNWN